MTPCATRIYESIDADHVLATETDDFLVTEDGRFILLYSDSDAVAECASEVWDDEQS